MHWEQRMDAPKGLPSLLREVVSRSNGLQDPRYMGHQVAVPFPDGALVGMVTDLLNNGGAIYEMGPTNSAMEEVLMSRLGEMMGLPKGCGGVMCHGGTLANLVALLAARRWKSGPDHDPWTEGDDQNGAVLVSAQAHYCVDRAVRIMGWGEKGVGLVETNAQHKITQEGLEKAMNTLEAQGRRVVAVVGKRLHHEHWGIRRLECARGLCRATSLVASRGWCTRRGSGFQRDPCSLGFRDGQGAERGPWIFTKSWGFPHCARACFTAVTSTVFCPSRKRQSTCGATQRTQNGGILERGPLSAPNGCCQRGLLR